MKKYFHKNKKYYTLFALSLVGILVLAIISPILIDETHSTWTEKLDVEVDLIQNDITKAFLEAETDLRKSINQVVSQLEKLEKETEINRVEIFDYFNKLEQNNFIGFFDENFKLICWNQNTYNLSEGDYFSSYESGQAYFLETELYSFLAISKIAVINSKAYKVLIAQPIEKKYHFQAEHYKKINFLEKTSKKYNTEFQLVFEQNSKSVKDGRYFSFELTNSQNNKIGIVTFQKPILDVKLNLISNRIASIQAMFLIVGVVFLIIGLAFHIRKLKSRFIKFFVFAVILFGFRILLFNIGFPANYFASELLKPAYFSSTFGYGIVKSPMELFISALFLVVVILLAFKFLKGYLDGLSTRKVIANRKRNVWLILFSIPLVLITIRALGAVVRSVVFDSTLLYFADFSFIPDIPIILMNLNILFIGFVAISICVIMITFLFVVLKQLSISEYVSLVIILILLIASSLVYHFLQNNPQVPIITKVIILLLSTSIAFIVFFNKNKSKPTILFLCALSSSIATVLLMNFYNSGLERESLKAYALDISRQKGNWYEYIVSENLSNFENRKMVSNSLSRENSNYSSLAFKIWAKSEMQKSAVNSKVSILDTNFNVLGLFKFNYECNSNLSKLKNQLGVEPLVSKTTNIYNNDQNIVGLVKIVDEKKLIGYLNIEINYDVDEINLVRSPKFIISNNQFAKSAIDFNKLRIYDFHNRQLNDTFGDFVLSSEQKIDFVQAEFNKFNEVWLYSNIGGELHLVYLLKTVKGKNERIIAVALEEKGLSFSLFHFFKVFFIHSLFILVSILAFTVFILLRYRKIQMGFRTKLLVAFLVISIIPLILMAVYFQNLTIEKNNSAIDYKLKKRAASIEEYINSNTMNNRVSRVALLRNAQNDLNIRYTLFADDSIFYSSEKMYYDIGLIPKLPNSIAYANVNLKDMHTYLANEFIENYEVNSIYYGAKILNRNLIIKVSDVFNPILLPMSSTEISIFLFGSYSLAAILIIIASTFLANQISSPIRKLTRATKSVASGDYGFELIEDTKGELQSLVDGFNTMVKQLKKSQTDLAEIERESAWKEMAKQVAHEIKNPLTPMKLSIQQLIIAYADKHPKFDEIFKKVTATQITQIETLVNIATEFSNFARMPKLKLEEVDLVKILKETIDLFADEKSTILLLNDAHVASVTADNDQLKRMFINLVRNSIQAGASKITLAIEEKTEEYFVRVKDNGTGIPAEISEKIFEEEFTTKVHGMGIGLSMAKRFIEIINGEIVVQESSSNGTTILIKLIKKS